MRRNIFVSALTVGVASAVCQWFVLSRGVCATVAELQLILLNADLGFAPHCILLPVAGGAVTALLTCAVGFVAEQYVSRRHDRQRRLMWAGALWVTIGCALSYPLYGLALAWTPRMKFSAGGRPFAIGMHLAVIAVCSGLVLWIAKARHRKTFWLAYTCFWAWWWISSLMFVNHLADFELP